MVQPPSSLFKYTSLEAAIAMFKTRRILCRHPRDFNDPFDCRFAVFRAIRHEQVVEFMAKELHQILSDGLAPTFTRETVFPAFLAELRARGDVLSQKEICHMLVGQDRDATNRFRDLFEGNDAHIDKSLGNMRIFCMSETSDNLLMWSHYGDEHRGVVVEFSTTGSSLFQHARPVAYQSELPRLASEQEWARGMLGLTDMSFLGQRASELPWIKSDAWSYEQEWRLLTVPSETLLDPLFAEMQPSELVSVRLGVRAPKSARDAVSPCLAGDLAHVEIMQMELSNTSFGFTA